MNTEITDNRATQPAGWIFFDAGCRLCVGQRQRWGRMLERRGFAWIPLQTPGTARRLGITEAQLNAEMWLELADGRKFSGLNTWSALMRHVWWMWPLGIVLTLPGFNALGRLVYRWIAKNRSCLGGACQIPIRHTKKPNRHGAFYELP